MTITVTLRRAALVAVAVALPLAPVAGVAQDLKIAVAADVTSIDPHFFNLFPNNNIAEHIFDKLVQMDADSRMIPGIATSWKALDDKTWEFKLRKGVKFHDGSELTAEDVAFSIDRVAQIPNSPGPFVAYTKAIVGKEIVDPYTIRFKTAAPHPLMPNDLSTIYIVQQEGRDRRVDRGLQHRQGDDRQRPLQVRPLRQRRSRRARAQRQLLGRQAAYEKVTFRIIKNEAARVAALLSGDVDAIEQPPTADLARAQVRSQVHGDVEDLASRHLLQLRPPDRVEPVRHRARTASRSTRIRCRTSACAARSARRSTARRSPSA